MERRWAAAMESSIQGDIAEVTARITSFVSGLSAKLATEDTELAAAGLSPLLPALPRYGRHPPRPY